MGSERFESSNSRSIIHLPNCPSRKPPTSFSDESRNESLCNRPEPCGIIRIQSIRCDASAKVRRALANGTCLVTILEITTAYAGEERRYRHQHRRRRTLLNCLPSFRRSLQAACMLLKVCCDSARINDIYKNSVLHPAARSLHREQNVRRLRLSIGNKRLIRKKVEVQVIEDDRCNHICT